MNTDTHSTEYNFSTTFDCAFADPACLDSIACKPVTGISQFALTRTRDNSGGQPDSLFVPWYKIVYMYM